jgi:7-cyano-7-deazaguanine synthase
MTQLLSQPEVLVLLSGGVDSAACLQIYSEMGKPICALFVDYGQPSAGPELSSAHAIAQHYSIQLAEAQWRGPYAKEAGLIPARNAFLILAALMERPSTVSAIVVGVHGGTDYPDCSRAFVAAMQGVMDLYENGAVQILAPLLDWQKIDVYEYCNAHGVPVNLTYSCEAGGPPPCGSCLSCKDRELLYAGT